MALHQVSIPDFTGMQISESSKYESLTHKIKYDSLPSKYLIEPGYGKVDLTYKNLMLDVYQRGIGRGY